ncbi:hypothetical protein H8D83_02340 [Candidatus Woesearchaeota archaeon]|nr:hypothetical protein [Candidatus Woesearchaeota archaeon]MBL7051232.1 hypothetical protein [Candidatus Woesearchaeota archaeon]
MPAQEPAPEKKGLFGQSAKEPSAPSIDPNLINQINDVSRRLRIAEENYSNLRKKTQLTDQNMLKSNKRIDTEIKAINEDTKEIRREIEDINSKIGQIAKELQIFAKKDEVKTLQKYVNLWEPIKFVTHDQVENIVRDIIEEK